MCSTFGQGGALSSRHLVDARAPRRALSTATLATNAAPEGADACLRRAQARMAASVTGPCL